MSDARKERCGDCYWYSPLGETCGRCIIPLEDVVPRSVLGIIRWEKEKFEHLTVQADATNCPFACVIGFRKLKQETKDV